MSTGHLAQIRPPSGWTYLRLDRLTDRSQDCGAPGLQPLSVFLGVGVVPRAERDDNHNRLGEDLSRYLVVKQNDIVFNKLRTWQGGLGISRYEGIVSPAYFVLRPRRTVESRYLHHLLRSSYYLDELTRRSKWMPPSQFDIPWDQLRTLPILLPPIETQRAIADFLDRKTKAIDALIQKKERLVELMQEKRQALITQAVTKGLDPGVPMKDSGIEWLGEIPAHWEAVPLRRVLPFIEQGWSPACDSRAADENEWGVLKSGCTNSGVFHDWENKALPPELTPRPSLEIQPGDLLMSRASGSPHLIGSCAFVAACRSHLMLSDKVFRLRPSEQVEPRYLAMALGSHPARHQIEGAISGAEGLANNITKGTIRSLVLPVSPKVEQVAILKALDTELATITTLSEHTATQLDKLREYRQALISAAVTGKIDASEGIS